MNNSLIRAIHHPPNAAPLASSPSPRFAMRTVSTRGVEDTMNRAARAKQLRRTRSKPRPRARSVTSALHHTQGADGGRLGCALDCR